jgi:dynein heavy chain
LLIKTTRVLATHQGNLVTVAVKGSAVPTLQRLACFALQLTLRRHELKSREYSRQDWLNDFKKVVLTAGLDDKGIVFQIDQF